MFSPTMNFLLTPDKVKEEKHVGVQCLYCKKVFKNHQALGGHLSAHQEEINSKRSWNYPSHFSNSVSITNNSPQPFSMRHPEIFSGGPLSSEVTPPLDFSKRLYSNENSWVNISRFYENNTSAMPPKCSSSSGHAEIQNSKPLSFIPPAPSGSMIPISVPLDPPFCLVSNGVCQFNTDQFRSFRDGMPSFSANAMPYFQDHNCGMIPYPVNAVTDLHPDLSSKQSLCFKEPIAIGSLPPDPSESSGQGEIGRYKTQTVSTSKGRKKHCIGGARGSAAEIMNPSKRPKKNSELLMETDKPPHPSQSSDQGEIGQYETQILLTSKGGKRHCLGEAGGSAEMMNCQWKRPKINSELSMETDKPPKRELLLFKDVENCFSRAGISSNAGEEEGQMDLDLSLHL